MSYGSKTWYSKGNWNVHCDVCGFKFKSDEIRKRWDGLMVCDADFELDHPQKFLRVKEDKQTVPFVRKNTDQFVNVCTLITSTGMADYGTADCMQADVQRSIPFLLDIFYTDYSAVAGIAIATNSIVGNDYKG